MTTQIEAACDPNLLVCPAAPIWAADVNLQRSIPRSELSVRIASNLTVANHLRLSEPCSPWTRSSPEVLPRRDEPK